MDSKGYHIRTDVDIKSHLLIEVLREINFDVEDISLLTTPPVVPLKHFFYNRQALQDRLDAERATLTVDGGDSDLAADLAVAVDFAKEEHATTQSSLDVLLPAGEITWDLLWTIFKPNALIYRHHRLVEDHQIMKVRTIRQGERPITRTKYWDINCHIVADDGVKFGVAREPFYMEIDEFSGTQKITDLRLFPLEYHPDAAKLRVDVLERGRRFAALKETQIMQTSGPAMAEKRDVTYVPHPVKFTTHGRVIVDPAGFRAFNPDVCFIPDVIRALSRDRLTEEQLMICTPVTFGFSFGDKKWGGFSMSRLTPITWNEQAFQELVMDPQTKMLIHSMVKQHSSHDGGFDDIISGKGKGMIGLFSGPPGSGKTLTAEAVAEITKRPLYSVSAGELGIEPHQVDEKLTRILELAHKWDAVLLLDEADVFLQQRDQENVRRNALVSIFLRQLEYYKGILILTTNRLANCDSAFESRIHISIPYDELDESAKRKVWNTFLQRAKGAHDDLSVEVSDEEIVALAKLDVNGRQIKNLVSGARTIAKEMNETLSMAQINLVLSVTNSRRTTAPGRRTTIPPIMTDVPVRTNGHYVEESPVEFEEHQQRLGGGRKR
ncbi:P-loop containing nucleoside triphosphate hydrolase protein [Podospora didyma]|uniref:P-loop containing nucleoside triphosphate hydrolase protein n=1 Tax=Podospora didyma TaxID=330526 RepID=A0AAE0NY56_9PEZI|nr:P-loop containing nucleoside triphosphate hydrolase protein [Podospora didyma]